MSKTAQELDEALIAEFTERIQKRAGAPELERLIDAFEQRPGAETLEEVESFLEGKGAFEIPMEKHSWRDVDGEEREVTITRAAHTHMWPMGTNWWARDNALIGARLLAMEEERGKDLLLSTLAILSSVNQLERFEAGEWPQIFLTIEDNLNAEREETWAHKQDAWQMAVYYVQQALDDGSLKSSDLSAKQQRFMKLAVPFLERTRYWKNENSGSWEELAAVRSSVLAWDIAVLQQGQSKDALIDRGKAVLEAQLPFESPGYEKDDPRYRETDAALIYLLQLGLLSDHQEKEVIDKVERLCDKRTGGIKRYLGDSYQGLSFFRNETALRLAELYGAPSGDASGIDHWIGRREIVPRGQEAAWVHPVWQMSWWAGVRYQDTSEQAYFDSQMRYFLRGLKLITKEGEVSLDQDEKRRARVIEIPAYRMPEAWLTELGVDGKEYIYPSPHTPLNWAVGEAMYAFAMMRRSLTLLN